MSSDSNGDPGKRGPRWQHSGPALFTGLQRQADVQDQHHVRPVSHPAHQDQDDPGAPELNEDPGRPLLHAEFPEDDRQLCFHTLQVNSIIQFLPSNP